MAASDFFYQLRDIEAHDPDGGEREPTEADYRAHEAWALAKYGREAWDRYQRGAWEHPSD